MVLKEMTREKPISGTMCVNRKNVCKMTFMNDNDRIINGDDQLAIQVYEINLLKNLIHKNIHGEKFLKQKLVYC